jgi:hypothetical protein
MSGLQQSRLQLRLRKLAWAAGVLPRLQRARAALRLDATRWIAGGCQSPAPEVVKKSIVRHYITSHRTPVFVETGTFLGNMVQFIADTGVQCHSIEIDAVLHARAKELLSGRSNVHLILGDSAHELPKLIADLSSPATFWLDGHYSGQGTGRGEIDTPISAELEAILDHPIKKHVILIDDARCFDGQSDYPKLHELLARFDQHPDYVASVSADIIRIVPR